MRTVSFPHGTGKAVRVDAGQRLVVTDLVGGEIATLFFFEPTDMTEFFSPSHTRVAGGTYDLRVGSSLYSNRRQPIAVVEESTPAQNMLLPACRSVAGDGQRAVRSCRSNVDEALAEYHAHLLVLPDPINLFQSVDVDPRGAIVARVSASTPGDHVTVRALRALLAVVSSCPSSSNSQPGGGDSLRLDVYREPIGGR